MKNLVSLALSAAFFFGQTAWADLEVGYPKCYKFKDSFDSVKTAIEKIDKWNSSAGKADDGIRAFDRQCKTYMSGSDQQKAQTNQSIITARNSMMNQIGVLRDDTANVFGASKMLAQQMEGLKEKGGCTAEMKGIRDRVQKTYNSLYRSATISAQQCKPKQ